MSADLTGEQRAWLADLPRLVRAIEQRWSVRLGRPYAGGTCAWVAPAMLPGGARAVLKIGWPHPEAAGEAEALRVWDGRGSVRLYRHDPERWALLLEWCDPGTKLGERSDLTVESRLRAAARVLRGLHRVAVPPEPDSTGSATGWPNGPT